MFKNYVALQGGQREFIERMKTESGQRNYRDWFENTRLAVYLSLIEAGGDFTVKKDADEMKALADEIRNEEPEVARFLDDARKNIEDFLRKHSPRYK